MPVCQFIYIILAVDIEFWTKSVSLCCCALIYLSLNWLCSLIFYASSHFPGFAEFVALEKYCIGISHPKCVYFVFYNHIVISNTFIGKYLTCLWVSVFTCFYPIWKDFARWFRYCETLTWALCGSNMQFNPLYVMRPPSHELFRDTSFERLVNTQCYPGLPGQTEEWADRNLKKITKDWCKVLYMGVKQLCWKEAGVVSRSKLNMSQ